jgi:hypothetical protein
MPWYSPSSTHDWPIAKTGWAHVRPVWPATDGNQQMMLHLDIECDDLPAAAADAIDLNETRSTSTN